MEFWSILEDLETSITTWKLLYFMEPSRNGFRLFVNLMLMCYSSIVILVYYSCCMLCYSYALLNALKYMNIVQLHH